MQISIVRSHSSNIFHNWDPIQVLLSNQRWLPASKQGLWKAVKVQRYDCNMTFLQIDDTKYVWYQMFMMLSVFVVTTQIFLGLPRPWLWRKEKNRRHWHRLILTGINIHRFVPWDVVAHWKYDVVWSFLKTLGLLGPCTCLIVLN